MVEALVHLLVGSKDVILTLYCSHLGLHGPFILLTLDVQQVIKALAGVEQLALLSVIDLIDIAFGVSNRLEYAFLTQDSVASKVVNVCWSLIAKNLKHNALPDSTQAPQQMSTGSEHYLIILTSAHVRHHFVKAYFKRGRKQAKDDD